jgi:hypothetical protein
MLNDVFRSTDAILQISSISEGDDGQAGATVIDEYKLNDEVGRLRNVTIRVQSDVRPFHEIGRRYPSHLRAGVLTVSGTVERAYVNGALIKLLLGAGAQSPPKEGAEGVVNRFLQPVFSIVTQLTDSAHSAQSTQLTVSGVRFDNWTYTVPLTDFVMESASFQALGLSIEETKAG